MINSQKRKASVQRPRDISISTSKSPKRIGSASRKALGRQVMAAGSGHVVISHQRLKTACYGERNRKDLSEKQRSKKRQQFRAGDDLAELEIASKEMPLLQRKVIQPLTSRVTNSRYLKLRIPQHYEQSSSQKHETMTATVAIQIDSSNLNSGVTTRPISHKPSFFKQPKQMVPMKSVNKEFRNLLNKRNVLSMQDQKEESRNLKEWLNQTNMNRELERKRQMDAYRPKGQFAQKSDSMINKWFQPANFQQNTTKGDSPDDNHQSSTLLHPDFQTTRILEQKEATTQRNDQCFTLTQLQYQDNVFQQVKQQDQDEPNQEFKIITPRAQQVKSWSICNGNLQLNYKMPSHSQTSRYNQHKQRTDIDSDPARVSSNRNTSIFESKNLMVGFQPILQSKVAGPYQKGPIIVEDKILSKRQKRQLNSNRNSLNEQLHLSRHHPRQLRFPSMNLQLQMNTKQPADKSQTTPQQSSGEKEKPHSDNNESQETHPDRDPMTSPALSFNSPLERINDPREIVISSNQETIPTQNTPMTERNVAQRCEKPFETVPEDERSSVYKDSSKQPHDSQSRAILSKKAGQITFDISRQECSRDISPRAPRVQERIESKKNLQIKKMFSQDEINNLNSALIDQKNQMIQYLNSLLLGQQDANNGYVNQLNIKFDSELLGKQIGEPGMSQLAQLAQIAQLLQLSEMSQNVNMGEINDFNIQIQQYNIISDITQRTLEQEKQLLKGVAQILGEHDRKLVPRSHRSRLIQSGRLRSKSSSMSKDSRANKYQSLLRQKMEDFKASMKRQMELHTHILNEGVDRNFSTAKQQIPLVKLESLSPQNLWTLANILKVQKEKFDKNSEFGKKLEELRSNLLKNKKKDEKLSQSHSNLQSSMKQSQLLDVPYEMTVISVPTDREETTQRTQKTQKNTQDNRQPDQILIEPNSPQSHQINLKDMQSDNLILENSSGKHQMVESLAHPILVKSGFSGCSDQDPQTVPENNTFDSLNTKTLLKQNTLRTRGNRHDNYASTLLQSQNMSKLERMSSQRYAIDQISPEKSNNQMNLMDHQFEQMIDGEQDDIQNQIQLSGSAIAFSKDIVNLQKQSSKMAQSSINEVIPVIETKRNPVVLPTTDESNVDNFDNNQSSINQYENADTSYFKVEFINEIPSNQEQHVIKKKKENKDKRASNKQPSEERLQNNINKKDQQQKSVPLEKNQRIFKNTIEKKFFSIRRQNQKAFKQESKQHLKKVEAIEAPFIKGSPARLFSPQERLKMMDQFQSPGPEENNKACPDDIKVINQMSRNWTEPGTLSQVASTQKNKVIPSKSKLGVHIQVNQKQSKQSLDRVSQQRAKNNNNFIKAQHRRNDDLYIVLRNQLNDQIQIIFQKPLSPRGLQNRVNSQNKIIFEEVEKPKIMSASPKSNNILSDYTEQYPFSMNESKSHVKIKQSLNSLNSRQNSQRYVENQDQQIDTHRIESDQIYRAKQAVLNKKSTNMGITHLQSPRESQLTHQLQVDGNSFSQQIAAGSLKSKKQPQNIKILEEAPNFEILNINQDKNRDSNENDKVSKDTVTNRANRSSKSGLRKQLPNLRHGETLTLREDGGTPISYQTGEQNVKQSESNLMMMGQRQSSIQGYHSTAQKRKLQGMINISKWCSPDQVLLRENFTDERVNQPPIRVDQHLRGSRVIFQQKQRNELDLLSTSARGDLLDTKKGKLVRIQSGNAQQKASNPLCDPDTLQKDSGMVRPQKQQSPIGDGGAVGANQNDSDLIQRGCQSVEQSDSKLDPNVQTTLTQDKPVALQASLNRKLSKQNTPNKNTKTNPVDSSGVACDSGNVLEMNGYDQAADRNQKVKLVDFINMAGKTHRANMNLNEIVIPSNLKLEQILASSPDWVPKSDQISNSFNFTHDNMDLVGPEHSQLTAPRLACNYDLINAQVAADFRNLQAGIPEQIQEQPAHELLTTSHEQHSLLPRQYLAAGTMNILQISPREGALAVEQNESGAANEFIEGIIQTFQQEQKDQNIVEVNGAQDNNQVNSNQNSNQSSPDKIQILPKNMFDLLISRKNSEIDQVNDQTVNNNTESIRKNQAANDRNGASMLTEAKRRMVLKKHSGATSDSIGQVMRQETQTAANKNTLIRQSFEHLHKKQTSVISVDHTTVLGADRTMVSLPGQSFVPDIKDQSNNESLLRGSKRMGNKRTALGSRIKQKDIVIKTSRKDHDGGVKNADLFQDPESKQVPGKPIQTCKRAQKRTGNQAYTQRYQQHHLQKGIVIAQRNSIASPTTATQDQNQWVTTKFSTNDHQKGGQNNIATQHADKLNIQGSRKILSGNLSSRRKKSSLLVIPQANDMLVKEVEKEEHKFNIGGREQEVVEGRDGKHVSAGFPLRQLNNFKLKSVDCGNTLRGAHSLSPPNEQSSHRSGVVIGTACKREPILRNILRTGQNSKLQNAIYSNLMPGGGAINSEKQSDYLKYL